MSIATDPSRSSDLEGLTATQLNIADSSDESPPGAQQDVLTRLEELEKLVHNLRDMAELSDKPAEDLLCEPSVGLKQEHRVQEIYAAEGNATAWKEGQNQMTPPTTSHAISEDTSSSGFKADPRYKYTTVAITGSVKRESPRDRPMLFSSIGTTKTAAAPHEYEIRLIKEGTQEEKAEYIIQSSGLKRLIWTVVKPSVQHSGSDKDWDNDKPLPLRPLMLYQHWDELQILSKPSNQAEVKENDLLFSLRHLLDDMEFIDKDKYMAFKELRDRSVTTSNFMQYLFAPGTYIVCFPFMDLPQVFQMDNCQYDKFALHLWVWGYDWDGTELRRIQYRFLIPLFKGERRINDLPVYPVNFYVDNTTPDSATQDNATSNKATPNVALNTGWPALRKAMARRADLFRKYCECKRGSQLFRYSGRALVLKPGAESPFAAREFPLSDGFGTRTSRFFSDPQNVDEEIIIDPASFITYGSNNQSLGTAKRDVTPPVVCKHCDTASRRKWINGFPFVQCENRTSEASRDFDEQHDHFMLLPSRVLGFLLGRKQWAQFCVEKIEPIIQDPTTDTKSQIALSKGMDLNKLRDMVKFHSSVVSSANESVMRDPIRGKGNGLIFLFHGPSGVGKTLTAEVLANEARMPLYKAGTSEIGTEPKEAEQRMRHLFELTQAWNAILLIDEADVFLDSRGSMGEGDLNKNAMVAVLLREVEYFSGILIMTTNRVMTFDVAMLSRIHWPINFGHLSPKQEEDIWKIWRGKWIAQNREMATRDDCENSAHDVEFETQKFDMWRQAVREGDQGSSGLNGREIRNIFLGARTMCNGRFVDCTSVQKCYNNTFRFRREMRDRQLTNESHLIAGIPQRL